MGLFKTVQNVNLSPQGNELLHHASQQVPKGRDQQVPFEPILCGWSI